MSQIKNAFDRTTVNKILKGAAIAGGGAAAVYLLDALSLMDLGQATPLVTAICAILINAIKEFRNGQ